LQLLNGVLYVINVFKQPPDVLLLTVDQLQDIHFSFFQPLLPLLLQFVPPADQLDAIDVFEYEPSLALLDRLVLLADESVTKDGVVAVHCH
jgi:protein-tyrosine phosphatase